MDRFPITSRVLLRLTVLAAVMLGQWVLPWAHVEFDHDHGHAAACTSQGDRDLPAVTRQDSSDHHAADCSVCDWIRTAQQGLHEPTPRPALVDVRRLDTLLHFSLPATFGHGPNSTRAPPFMG